jgi:hypothetical protein
MVLEPLSPPPEPPPSGAAGYFVPTLARPGLGRFGWGLLWRWTLASLASAGIVVASVLVINEVLEGVGFQTPVFWVAVIGGMAVGGLLAGMIQLVALRRYVALDRIAWLLASTLGMGAGMGLAFVADENISSGALRGELGWALARAVDRLAPFVTLGFSVGLAQWLALRRQLPYGWSWLLVHAVSAAVIGLVSEVLRIRNDLLVWGLPIATYLLLSTSALVGMLWPGRPRDP